MAEPSPQDPPRPSDRPKGDRASLSEEYERDGRRTGEKQAEVNRNNEPPA